MDEQRLQEIKQRAEKATPGTCDTFMPNPLEAQRHVVRTRYLTEKELHATSFIAECYCGGVDNAANAALFAHSRQDILELISEVERLQQENAALLSELARTSVGLAPDGTVNNIVNGL